MNRRTATCFQDMHQTQVQSLSGQRLCWHFTCTRQQTLTGHTQCPAHRDIAMHGHTVPACKKLGLGQRFTRPGQLVPFARWSHSPSVPGRLWCQPGRQLLQRHAWPSHRWSPGCSWPSLQPGLRCPARSQRHHNLWAGRAWVLDSTGCRAGTSGNSSWHCLSQNDSHHRQP